jgi:hypothetical protein
MLFLDCSCVIVSSGSVLVSYGSATTMASMEREVRVLHDIWKGFATVVRPVHQKLYTTTCYGCCHYWLMAKLNVQEG